MPHGLTNSSMSLAASRSSTGSSGFAFWAICAGWLTLLLAAFPCHAQAPASKPDGIPFFEQKIRPILVKHCYSCHSTQAKKARGGLKVDTRDALLKGGDSGPALVAGKPESSLLIKALRHDEIAMPPKEKLPDEVVNDFVRWIGMGAPDPRDGKVAPVRTGIDVEAGRKFWAFQPPRRHDAPPIRDTAWPRGVVDRFILAALEAKGLRPARDADRATLLRRLSLDLTGLPPTPEEIDAFIADRSPDAWVRVVDRLLGLPAFGERWGRHWLDLARYADSNGKDENFTYHDAWRYRDHVIAAFNADKPFNRIIREQIAGDLMPAADQRQRDELLTATGFLVVGPKMLFDRDKFKQKMDVVDEQIDTIGRTFLGLTLGCARCHDHKFDPVPTTDYYALAGILASTRTLDGTRLGNPLISGWMVRPLGTGGEKLHAARVAHQKKLEAATDTLKKAESELRVQEAAKAPSEQLDALRERVKTLSTEEAKLKATLPSSPPLVMAVRDEDRPADMRVNIRGNPAVLGEQVPRGFLRVASTNNPAIPSDRSGRLELAEWLASGENPLTARVLVNRVWMHLFGEGLVRTVDDFGAQGERPTHPELLDTLAVQFAEEGWSIKKLVRSLVLSHAYQIAIVDDANAARIDPDNRLLWRAHRRRLEAEVLRDAMLSVAGQLRREMGGSSVRELGEHATNNNAKERLDTEGNRRRSIYLPVIRNGLPSLFEVFDFADPDATTGKRNATTVPTQALYLLNSPFVMEQARRTAELLLAAAETDESRLVFLYRRALGRTPTNEEERTALRFLRSQTDENEVEAWAAVCQAMFSCTEFRFVE
jgi:hypothetical protein